MSFIITTISPETAVQVSETRHSSLENQSVSLSESLRKTLILKGSKTHFVLGWIGLASTRFGHNTADWLFRTLAGMNAAELTIEDIAQHLEAAATDRFNYMSAKEKHKHTVFTMAGWQQGEPFVCTVSNYLTVLNSVSPNIDVRHHIPSVLESVAIAPKFSAMIQRFDNLKKQDYLVHVMGDFDPDKLKPHFMGLESLLKKRPPASDICGACRRIALEAVGHSKTIGKNLIGVEMDSTGHTMCSFYSEGGADEMLIPDFIGVEGCSTQSSLTLNDDGTARAQAKIAKKAG
jgi:hypothetical protein